MARLRFFYGPMGCGKSTLALQTHHNLTRSGVHVALLTSHDRTGRAQVTSRLGISAPADAISSTTELHGLLATRHQRHPIGRVLVDEAQFLTATQVEQLAGLVDYLDVDVDAFGIATDFRAQLFAGSARLFELADVHQALQVSTACWCGSSGRMNARVIDGKMVRDGEQIAVGDTHNGQHEPTAADVGLHYEVLCRKHYIAGQLRPHQHDLGPFGPA